MDNTTTKQARCTAKYDRQIRCELPKGHAGEHTHGNPAIEQWRWTTKEAK
jgi:hypothetical protein